MTSTKDICWLAGILEGEGCFCYQCSPGIRVGMTDKDIIERIASLIGHNVRGPYKYRVNKKPVYYTEIWGSKAISWMMTLYCLMGNRRKERIKEIVTRWRLAPTKAHKLGTARVNDCGHTDRKHYAHGLCRSCYKKSMRDNNGIPPHKQPV